MSRMQKVAGLCTACIAVAGCEARFHPTEVVSGSEAWNCIRADNCRNKSVELTGVVKGYSEGQILLAPSSSDEQGFKVSHADFSAREGAEVRIRGVVVDGAFFEDDLIVRAYETLVLAPPPRREPPVVEVSKKPPRKRVREESAEEMIARNREMGRQALDEWDAAIRQNNDEMRANLAAAAVTHRMTTSHGLRVDVYGMPDGRYIACKTTIVGSAPPITSCDGEP